MRCTGSDFIGTDTGTVICICIFTSERGLENASSVAVQDIHIHTIHTYKNIQTLYYIFSSICYDFYPKNVEYTTVLTICAERMPTV